MNICGQLRLSIPNVAKQLSAPHGMQKSWPKNKFLDQLFATLRILAAGNI